MFFSIFYYLNIWRSAALNLYNYYTSIVILRVCKSMKYLSSVKGDSEIFKKNLFNEYVLNKAYIVCTAVDLV